jgi:uncharacterized protein (DUF58 family)
MVTADEALAVCHEMAGIPERLRRLVQARQAAEFQKAWEEMAARGARECRSCGVLVIPVPEKHGLSTVPVARPAALPPTEPALTPHSHHVWQN